MHKMVYEWDENDVVSLLVSICSYYPSLPFPSRYCRQSTNQHDIDSINEDPVLYFL